MQLRQMKQTNKGNHQSPNKPSRFTRDLRPRINITSGLEPTAVFSHTRAVIVLGCASGLSLFILIHDIRCRTEGRAGGACRCLPTLRWISIRCMQFYRVFLLSCPCDSVPGHVKRNTVCIWCSLTVPHSIVAYLPT
jgi:hypothetical protein